MAEPAIPGWYADPERTGRQRWWNGLGWSDAWRSQPGAAAAGPPPAPAPAPPVDPTAVEVTRRPAATTTAGTERPSAKRNAGPANGPATSGLGFAVIATIFGFAGVPAVVAVVLSAIGLVRGLRLLAGGSRKHGIVPALLGLALGIVGVVRAAAEFLPALEGSFPGS